MSVLEFLQEYQNRINSLAAKNESYIHGWHDCIKDMVNAAKKLPSESERVSALTEERDRAIQLRDGWKDAAHEKHKKLVEVMGDLQSIREALAKLIPIAECGGNLGQVCNGCQRNSFEFGEHSENCPVRLARAALSAPEGSKRESV